MAKPQSNSYGDFMLWENDFGVLRISSMMKNVQLGAALLFLAFAGASLRGQSDEEKIKLETKDVPLGKVSGSAFLDTLVVSADNRRVAYAGLRGGRWVATVDGAEGKPYDRVIGLTFSPDGKKVAHVARREDKWLVVVDGLDRI